MEWVETTGRTIEEAKDAALDQLGVDESDAEFVVLTEPKAGLFGRLRGEARVRARVRPTSPRPKRTRTRRQGERQGSRRSGGRSAARDTGSTTAVDDDEGGEDAAAGTAGEASSNGAGGTRSRNRRSRGRSGRGPRPDDGAVAGANGKGSEGPTAPPGSGQRQGQAPGRARAGRGGGTKEETVGEVLTLEEQGESAREFVAGLIRELGMDADVSSRIVDEDTAEVVVEGQELGVLIGPGGATLGALQELARTFVQKRTGGQSSRIVVDVAGYRAKRAAALQRFTQQVGDEVRASGDERALEPMSAADRKVVHDAANALPGLGTRSEGEEPRRYIVIFPTQDSVEVTDGDG